MHKSINCLSSSWEIEIPLLFSLTSWRFPSEMLASACFLLSWRARVGVCTWKGLVDGSVMYDSIHVKLPKEMPGTKQARIKMSNTNVSMMEWECRVWELIMRAGEDMLPLQMCHEESLQFPRGAGHRPGKKSYQITVWSAVQILSCMLALKMRAWLSLTIVSSQPPNHQMTN